MAVVPVFIDADISTKLQMIHLQDGDIIVVTLPPDVLDSATRHAVQVLKEAVTEAGFDEKVGIVITKQHGFSFKVFNEQQMLELGYKRA